MTLVTIIPRTTESLIIIYIDIMDCITQKNGNMPMLDKKADKN